MLTVYFTFIIGLFTPSQLPVISQYVQKQNTKGYHVSELYYVNDTLTLNHHTQAFTLSYRHYNCKAAWRKKRITYQGKRSGKWINEGNFVRLITTIPESDKGTETLYKKVAKGLVKVPSKNFKYDNTTKEFKLPLWKRQKPTP